MKRWRCGNVKTKKSKTYKGKMENVETEVNYHFEMSMFLRLKNLKESRNEKHVVAKTKKLIVNRS